MFVQVVRHDGTPLERIFIATLPPNVHSENITEVVHVFFFFFSQTNNIHLNPTLIISFAEPRRAATSRMKAPELAARLSAITVSHKSTYLPLASEAQLPSWLLSWRESPSFPQTGLTGAKSHIGSQTRTCQLRVVPRITEEFHVWIHCIHYQMLVAGNLPCINTLYLVHWVNDHFMQVIADRFDIPSSFILPLSGRMSLHGRARDVMECWHTREVRLPDRGGKKSVSINDDHLYHLLSATTEQAKRTTREKCLNDRTDGCAG